ncbi:hypothetical protein CLOP_g16473 [Closterium sp. NIES-67]|nr:hypothetical protein CLOP_g16473 [Closterium sp. NIES-67]
MCPQEAKIAAPLTNLLKRTHPINGSHTSRSRGAAETSTHVPHSSSSCQAMNANYVIEADASDQVVGALLMQYQGDGLQPIAYLSKKMHEAELNYPIHDKKALAIVIAFKTWRCYLEGRRTTVYTDHCSLKYLKTQPNLSRRQFRWIDFLETHFHYEIVYKPDHKNKAHTLNRPAHNPAFHVQLLKPYRDPHTIFTSRQPPLPPPILVHDELEYEVESLLAHRQRQHGTLELLIRWMGYDPSEDCWVPESDMGSAHSFGL